MRAILDFLLLTLIILLVRRQSGDCCWLVVGLWLGAEPLAATFLAEGAILVGLGSGLALLIWFQVLDWIRNVTAPGSAMNPDLSDD
ncbi:MAG: hypothetical protein IPL78_29655 [Chloroflexi bacterium]|nr:hypothetical protein [Chloroflexota bacterium]